MAAGILLVVIAFSLDTTVGTGSGRVHNIGLQAQQTMLLILGCALFIGGLVLFSTYKIRQTKEDEETLAAARRAEKNAPKPAVVMAPEYSALGASECVERLTSLNYRVDAWFGVIWMIGAPDRKSLEVALGENELRKALAKAEASTTGAHV